MAAQTGTDFEGTFNHVSTGLYKDNTTNDISEADLRALPTAVKESYLNRIDDAYTGSFPQVTASGTNTYTATAAPAITAYATGQKFQIKFTNASSAVSTLNLNSVGAKKIFINPTTQATTSHIVAGQISLLVYDAALDAAAGGFLMIGAPTVGGVPVTSVTGTASRITSSGGATPVIDIDEAYDAAVQAIADAKVANSITNGVTTSAPNQDQVFDALALKQAIANTASALTDGASIDITGAKHTLTTDEATITFTQSFTGDYTNIDVTFNTTAATWTFPSGSLCVVEGSASGNNTATIAAVSGDKIVISVWFVSSGQYRVAVKNFGQ